MFSFMPLWLLFALLSAATAAVASLYQKHFLARDRHDSVLTGSLYQIATGIGILASGWLFGLMQWRYTTQALQITAGLVIIYIIGATIYYIVLKKLDISVITIISSSRSIYTLIAGYVLFGEMLDRTQIIGMVLILFAIVLTQFKNRARVETDSFILLIIFTIIVGVGTAIERRLLTQIDLYLYLFLAFAIPGIVSHLYQRVITHKSLHMTRSYLWSVGLVGMFQTLSSVTMMYALASAPTATQPSIASQTRTLMVVIGAWVFLGEKTHTKTKLMAACICICGMILLI
jgi:drug/metabolite transporter (DMT)-like permease